GVQTCALPIFVHLSACFAITVTYRPAWSNLIDRNSILPNLFSKHTIDAVHSSLTCNISRLRWSILHRTLRINTDKSSLATLLHLWNKGFSQVDTLHDTGVKLTLKILWRLL